LKRGLSDEIGAGFAPLSPILETKTVFERFRVTTTRVLSSVSELIRAIEEAQEIDRNPQASNRHTTRNKVV
jgi:hypothetical protein